jgi:SAM-dependent methyltransferase
METYILDGRGSAERRRRESARLDVLHEATGPWAIRLLRERGVGPGWRCLDVGAGAGHISRWLADHVAPDGQVVATDIDTDFLDELGDARLEVRRHDILSGPVEQDAFDLVVARAVLVHLRDRVRGVRNMAASLKPGGWLVLIDPSLPQTPRVLQTSDAALHDRVFTRWNEFLQTAGVEHDAAGSLALAGDAGLDADGEGLIQTLRAGNAAARLWALTVAASAQPMIDRGAVTRHDVDALAALMAQPEYLAIQLLGHATWARRPLAGHETAQRGARAEL